MDYQTIRKRLNGFLRVLLEKATGKLILLWFRRNAKQVKNKNAVRIVPMNNKLIEIGYIEYVDSVNRKGEERVFLN